MDAAAWFFVVIAASESWTTVDAGFIGALDAVNHAVPSYAESERAISFLVGNGLVEARGSEVRLTEAGRSLAERTRKGTWAASRAQVEALLSRMPSPGSNAWTMDERAFDQVVDSYLEQPR